MTMRIGVEVGGTFTDLVQYDGAEVTISKVPSVPSSPDEGVFAALMAAGSDLAALDELTHGSTVAVNAILERKGARLGFITTRGFRDILLLQRHDRLRMFDLFYRKPEPVVSRLDAIEVDERIFADGAVERALDLAATRESLAAFLAGRKLDAVAVCLLNAYANPVHERAVRDLLHAIDPELFVTCSSEVGREFREYERASTTTLAAYVQPTVNRYLGRLENRLKDADFRGRLSIMQSNGGCLPVAGIRQNALVTLFSGPSAGVVGAIRQVASDETRNLITLDVGGTSADVCLVTDARPEMINETSIDGLPVHVPVIDIVSVGAGGGSILWADEGGMLRVGPDSAGAAPGPICYGRGGERPTLTDAQLVRGALPGDALLAGSMKLAYDPAQRRLAELAARFDMTAEALSDSAVRIANANMIAAIKAISTERGKDPRDYALVAFGGAGPLHATELADELGITTIVIPPFPGVLSAYGLLVSDHHVSDSRTRLTPVDAAAADIVRAIHSELAAQASGRLRALGIEGDIETSFALDMRFSGQAFEIHVPLEAGDLVGLTAQSIRLLFHEKHHQLYQHGLEDKGKPVEIVAFRMETWRRQREFPHLKLPRSGSTPNSRQGRVFLDGHWNDCPILPRESITRETSLQGICIIEDKTSTALVGADWKVGVDPRDNIVLRKVR
jgi:N-methylhydantoinase A